MKSVVGLMLGLLIGAASRWFEIPVSAPRRTSEMGDAVNFRKNPVRGPHEDGLSRGHRRRRLLIVLPLVLVVE